MKKLASFVAALAIILCSCCNKNCDNAATTPDAVASDQKSEIVRLNVFYTLNDLANADAAKTIADSLVAASRNDAGCISYDMFESTTTPGSFIIIETWQNDSLLDIHSHAPHFEKYVPQLRALGTMTAQRCTIEE
ncbi:MAG: antibiotic biosynthesis monooxygenase [Muribaculaceae bacterium]|nr:antibiotic biosynthesis monooxygenase [Muribaculaceae bacterium]